MTEFLWFFVGLLIGGIVATLMLCCLQLKRLNDYEAEIQDLKSKLNIE